MTELKCTLAQIDRLFVFRVNHTYFIAAQGYRPSTTLTPQLRILESFPPQYQIMLCGEPGPMKMTSFAMIEDIMIPGDFLESLTVHTASGSMTVSVTPLPSPFTGGPYLGLEANENTGHIAEGYSSTLSMDEAIKDATSQLLQTGSSTADDFLSTEVLEIKTGHGGFPGLNYLAVKVHGKWASESNA